MKKVFFAVLFFSVLVLAQQTPPKSDTTPEAPKKDTKASSGKLEDVTITGEDKTRVKSDKPYLDIKMDINEVILPTIETEKKFLEKSPSLTDLKDAMPKMLNSPQVASPYLITIVKEPIANFAVKVLGEVKTATWNLVVTDSKGRIFKKFEGKGKPPASIAWSGRNAENRIVKVGNAYSYLVNLIDEAGNPHTLIGAPFVIHALNHQEEDGLYVSFTRKRIFDVEKDKKTIIETNLAYLKEASDYVKENFTLPIRVDVYGENAALAAEQAKVVAKYFTDELILPEGQIKSAGYEDSIENHRVDIVIKNR